MEDVEVVEEVDVEANVLDTTKLPDFLYQSLFLYLYCRKIKQTNGVRVSMRKFMSYFEYTVRVVARSASRPNFIERSGTDTCRVVYVSADSSIPPKIELPIQNKQVEKHSYM